MALFDTGVEKQRKENLKVLEEKRVAFAERLNKMGFQSDQSLYSQMDGGFCGVVISKDQFLYITGPGPGDTADFSVKAYPALSMQIEDVLIPSEGMGGILGMGKRGGIGYNVTLIFPDGESGEFGFVSGRNYYFEHDHGKDPLFDTRKRRGNANFVWEFSAIESSKVNEIITRWTNILEETR